MKRYSKRALAVLLALTMLILPAASADNRPEHTFMVYLNGMAVEFSDVTPIIAETDGWKETLYLPLRALLETMGGEVGYDKGLVTATYKGKTLTFNINGDSSDGTVEDAGGTAPCLLDPAPVLVNRRVLVAAETLRDVFGLLITLDWSYMDAEEHDNQAFREALDKLLERYYRGEIDWYTLDTVWDKLAEELFVSPSWHNRLYEVSVIDLSAMLDGMDGRFSMLNKILAAYTHTADKPISFTGNIDGMIELDMPYMEYFGLPSTFTLPLEAGIDVRFSGQDSSGEVKLGLDLDALLPLIIEEAGQDEAAVYAMLKDVALSYILNSKDGMIYLQSPLFEAMGEAPGDAWIALPSEWAVPYPLTASLIIEQIIRSSVEDSYYMVEYAEVELLAGLFELLLGDDSFAVSGSAEAPVYTLKLDMESLMPKMYGLAVASGVFYEDLEYEEFKEYFAYFFGGGYSQKIDFDLSLTFAPGKDGADHISASLWFMTEEYGSYTEMILSIDAAVPGPAEASLLLIAYDDWNESTVTADLTYKGASAPFDGTIPSAPPEGSTVLDEYGDPFQPFEAIASRLMPAAFAA